MREMLMTLHRDRDPEVKEAIETSAKKLRLNEQLQREIEAIAKEIRRRDFGETAHGSRRSRS